MKTRALAPWFGSNRTLAHHVGAHLDGCEWVGVPFVRHLYPAELWAWHHLTGGKTQTNAPAPEVLLVRRAATSGTSTTGPERYAQL